MADTIQIKRGNTAGGTLADGELGYSREDKALYIGDNGTNQRLTGAIESIETLAIDSMTSEVVKAFNSLITAMKNSGMMK